MRPSEPGDAETDPQGQVLIVRGLVAIAVLLCAAAAGIFALGAVAFSAPADDPSPSADDPSPSADGTALAGQDGDREPAAAASDDSPKASTRTLAGRVVWLMEALSERFGIRTVPEAADRVLALQTPDGRLYPIAEDSRGRAFRRDQRLREMDLELTVRQYDGSPMVQVVRVVALKPEGKFEVDYWCEVCAIPMYEQGPCDCCQAPNELRLRPTGDREPGTRGSGAGTREPGAGGRGRTGIDD